MAPATRSPEIIIYLLSNHKSQLILFPHYNNFLSKRTQETEFPAHISFNILPDLSRLH